MKAKLLHKLLTVSEYIFEEITDELKDKQDLGRKFWQFVKSNLLNDGVKKIKVSDYVYQEILQMDANEFGRKYGVKLENIKKSNNQMQFVCTCVTTLLHYSDKGNHMIDWS